MPVSCWIGSFTFELCCAGPWGVGLASCWDDHFNWKICCEAELQKRLSASGHQDTENTSGVLGLQGPPSWQQNMADCIATYDTPANFRFYQRHSSLLGHDIAHVGNPEVCWEASHRFFWGFLAFRLTGSWKDVALEFGMCVPKSCSYAVVDTIFVPYLLGRYMGRSWGPKNPEILTRWHHQNEIEKEDTASHFVFNIVALHPGGPSAWYQDHWPYRQKLWQYHPSWWPSKQNELVLTILAFPPILAAVCLALLRLCGKSSSWLRIFAPQRHLADLCRSTEDDLSSLHLVRLILQLLVNDRLFPWALCFDLKPPMQSLNRFLGPISIAHAEDWLGNSGHGGIESFQPLTSQVAKILGRVNHTFACVSAYLSLRSMERALAAAGPGGLKKATVVCGRWLLSRWLRQVCELGFWMWFFLCLSQDIPWKPFPEFAQIWYQDRRELCLSAPVRRSCRLPQEHVPSMWLLSLMFVYAPVNAALKLYQPVVSVCHNMQIFENLFAVSVLSAGVGLVKHFFGYVLGLLAGTLLIAMGLWWEPEIINEGFRPGHRFVGMTTAHLLPGALLCALVKVPRTSVRIPLLFLALSLLVDWLTLPPTQVIDEQSPRLVADMIFSPSKAATFAASNGLHACAIALLLGNMAQNGSAATPSWWVMLASRLSLGVNLSNIFAIHYLRGRLMLMPVEFHHVHVMGYTLWAWAAAVVASAVVYCLVTPYALLGDAVLKRLSNALLGKPTWRTAGKKTA
ncbi:unnamed protein product [Effrenium voratum]|nr:unnamed protein product [Effrenium voratum]